VATQISELSEFPSKGIERVSFAPHHKAAMVHEKDFAGELLFPQ
jgi:hypothetical protein